MKMNLRSYHQEKVKQVLCIAVCQLVDGFLQLANEHEEAPLPQNNPPNTQLQPPKPISSTPIFQKHELLSSKSSEEHIHLSEATCEKAKRMLERMGWRIA